MFLYFIAIFFFIAFTFHAKMFHYLFLVKIITKNAQKKTGLKYIKFILIKEFIYINYIKNFLAYHKTFNDHKIEWKENESAFI